VIRYANAGAPESTAPSGDLEAIGSGARDEEQILIAQQIVMPRQMANQSVITFGIYLRPRSGSVGGNS